MLKRIMFLIVLISVVFPNLPLYSLAANESNEIGSTSSTTINNYNYYYLNDALPNYVDLHSLNNTDPEAYWRPKLDELNINIKDYLELEHKDLKVNKNVFDASWQEINKIEKQTNRSLEILGYDYLLYKDVVDLSTGKVERTPSNRDSITAPHFIMNVYKALGMELYNVYLDFDKSQSKVGAYVSRTDPEAYWRLFLNDHPIDYMVYDDTNLDEAGMSGGYITGADAIAILSQMIDFYGEPIISKQEEYMLLQVYGDKVPVELTSVYKDAWSYLKCRGIIGEDEISYNSPITLEDSLDLLSRIKDKGSRYNFKEIQITTNLDYNFIKNGFYAQNVDLQTGQYVTPTSITYDYSNANRLDYLIEITPDIIFKDSSSGEVNNNIFISKYEKYDSQAIKGSVFHGVVQGKYYHFSLPISEVTKNSVLYINSSNNNDFPLNYSLSNSNGGIYSDFDANSGIIKFDKPYSFNEYLPDTSFVDKERKGVTPANTAKAGGNDSIVRVYYDLESIDLSKTEREIISVFKNAKLTKVAESLEIAVPQSSIEQFGGIEAINRRVVLSSKYYSSLSKNTYAILSLKGDGLLVSLAQAKDEFKSIKDFEFIPDSNSVIVYFNDGAMAIVDNEQKTIQNGSAYLQINEGQDLFTFKGKDILIDFRALYGTKENAFSITQTSSGVKVTLYPNRALVASSTDRTNKYKVGEYFINPTDQSTVYIDGSNNSVQTQATELNVAYKLDKVSGDIKEVYLPLSNSNPMGNYLQYSEYTSSGVDKHYLVTFHLKEQIGDFPNRVKTLDQMFWYYPDMILGEDSLYSYNVMEIRTKETKTLVDIAGIGMCYKLDVINQTETSMNEFLVKYTGGSKQGRGSKQMPYAYGVSTNGTNKVGVVLNFNRNYYGKDSYYTSVKRPVLESGMTVYPAPVGVQSWVTNPDFVSTVSKDTVIDNMSKLIVNYGTDKVNSNGRQIVLYNLGFSLDNLFVNTTEENSNSMFRSSNHVYAASGTPSYKNPRYYSLQPFDVEVSLSPIKGEQQKDTIRKELADLQKFFDKYNDITFKDLITGVDNTLSIVYYLATRMLPLIVFSMLILILIISSVSDIRIVQIFCTKVIDPVKFLTFGKHSIQTVNNKYLILSIMGALILMGIIQNGNLEKLIVWGAEWYFAVMRMFN